MTLIQSTESVFNQLTNLLISLDDDQYAYPLEILNGNSIGKHVRHIVEFYECLVNCSAEGANLDYDLRKRNLAYETDTMEVVKVFELLRQQIGTMNCSGRIIDLNFLTHPDERTKLIVGTTVERELAYNLEHAIHHMAIIRIAVNLYFKEINLGHSFGIAPSTLKYINNISSVPVNR